MSDTTVTVELTQFTIEVPVSGAPTVSADVLSDQVSVEIAVVQTSVVEVAQSGVVVEVPVSGASPQIEATVHTATVDVVTERAVVIEAPAAQGPPGPQGPAGNGVDIAFAWGDASPVPIAEVSGVVISASITIQTALNGVNPQLTIGTLSVPSLVMSAADNFADEVGRYETNPGVDVAEQLYLFITPGLGASQGDGVVYLELAS